MLELPQHDSDSNAMKRLFPGLADMFFGMNVDQCISLDHVWPQLRHDSRNA